MRRVIIVLGSIPLALLGFTACDDNGDGGETVDVVLSEFIIEPDPTEAAAGEIDFETDNQGGEVHEFVVVRAPSAEDLPTDADGAVDEDQIPEADQLGEIEDIEAGDSPTLTVDLKTGDYVLFCNIVEEEDGEVESHFVEGMHTTFAIS